MYSSALPMINKKWLVIAVGKDEADEAMKLPAETQEALYGDILRFGPAGDAIRKVMDAKLAAYDYHSHKSELITNLHNVNEVGWALHAWRMRSPEITTETNESLMWNVRFNGSLALYWMMNGQMLFSPDMWNDTLAHYIRPANRALELLGFPELTIPKQHRVEDWWWEL